MAGIPRRSLQNGPRGAFRPTVTSEETTRTAPDRTASFRPRPSARPVVEDALNRLFRDYHSQLLRLCRIHTNDAPKAEGLAQDASLAVRGAYPDKAIDELRPLLFTLLRNLTPNYLKSGNTKRPKTSVDLRGQDNRLGCLRTAKPEIQLMGGQLLAFAEQVIVRMPPRRRDVLKLHRFQQLTYEEIAECVGVSRSTVKKDLADAIAEVAEALARISGPGADSRTVRK